MTALYDIPRQFIIGPGERRHRSTTRSPTRSSSTAFLCAFVIGPLLGGIGTMVVAKRMAFFSQAVGNAALTGVAIGVIIGESYTAPYMSMFSFCLLFGLLLNFARNRTKMSADTLIGVFLSISLAIGATALLWVSAKVNTHILDTVMFGSILTVNDTDMTVLLVTTRADAGHGAAAVQPHAAREPESEPRARARRARASARVRVRAAADRS